MRVTEINNLNFQSRDIKIRNADAVARHVNNLFPRVSTTKLMSYNHYNQSVFAKKNSVEYRTNQTRRKLNNMRWANKTMATSKRPLLDKVSQYIDLVKETRVGNCGESAFLGKIVLECNGIKNSSIAVLYGPEGEIDHSVLYVNDKKPYIIDPWLGFADYLPKAFEHYISEFNKLMCFSEREQNYIDSITRKTGWFKFVNAKRNHIYGHVKFSDALIDELLKKYPELKLNNIEVKN